MISESSLNALQKAKHAHKKIVLVGGCFDLIHPGHIRFLNNAKKLGDFLVVILESDQSVIKSKNTLIQTQKERKLILSNFRMIDLVIPLKGILDDKKYYTIVKKIKPDIIAITENDAQIANKKRQAEELGGQVVVATKRIPEYSSSKLRSVIKK